MHETTAATTATATAAPTPPTTYYLGRVGVFLSLGLPRPEAAQPPSSFLRLAAAPSSLLHVRDLRWMHQRESGKGRNG